MRSGLEEANAESDVLEWLLEEENPSIRYLTLTKLLHASYHRKEAVEARKRIPTWEPVRRILARQKRNGGWDAGRTWYLPKYKSTIWQLLILSQTGIEPDLPSVRRMCEYAFRYQMRSHGFNSGLTQDRKNDRACLTSCLNGNVIAALCRLGYGKDVRVRDAVEHLLTFQEPDCGWGCRTFGYHKYDKHSCFMGTICALDGLLEYSEHIRNRSVERSIRDACEFLLMHHLYKADHHGWKIIKDDFVRLKAPWLVSYDILRGLRALTRAGFARDERTNDARELLISKRRPNGRWIRETPWPSATYSHLGWIGEEDKWVTLNALLALGEGASSRIRVPIQQPHSS